MLLRLQGKGTTFTFWFNSKVTFLYLSLCLIFGGRMENPDYHPGNSFEEKNILEDSLPDRYHYKINKFEIIDKSDIKEEIKFQAKVCVNT